MSDSFQFTADVLEYCRNKGCVDVLSADNHSLEFTVKTHLCKWDPEMLEILMKSGSFYRGFSEARKKLLDEIFSANGRMRIRMCARYKLDEWGVSVPVPPPSCSDWIAHPYLHKYKDIGTYECPIIRCMRTGDIAGAIDICIEYAGYINLWDDIARRVMFEEVFGTSAKVVEILNRISVSPEDALAWLNSHDKKKEENT